MVGWHHQLNRTNSEQALGDGEGQGSLACCSPWGCKKSDTTDGLNNNRPGIKLRLSVVTAQSPNHGAARHFPLVFLC